MELWAPTYNWYKWSHLGEPRTSFPLLIPPFRKKGREAKNPQTSTGADNLASSHGSYWRNFIADSLEAKLNCRCLLQNYEAERRLKLGCFRRSGEWAPKETLAAEAWYQWASNPQLLNEETFSHWYSTPLPPELRNPNWALAGHLETQRATQGHGSIGASEHVPSMSSSDVFPISRHRKCKNGNCTSGGLLLCSQQHWIPWIFGDTTRVWVVWSRFPFLMWWNETSVAEKPQVIKILLKEEIWLNSWGW